MSQVKISHSTTIEGDPLDVVWTVSRPGHRGDQEVRLAVYDHPGGMGSTEWDLDARQALALGEALVAHARARLER